MSAGDGARTCPRHGSQPIGSIDFPCLKNSQRKPPRSGLLAVRHDGVAPFLRVAALQFRVATSRSGDDKSEGAGLIEAGVSRSGIRQGKKDRYLSR